MAFNRVRRLSVFSRKVLLLLLLLAPRQDPLYFSVQSGQSLIPDPGVTLSLSQPSRHGFLPGQKAVLSLIYFQALTDTFSDLLSSLILTLLLMWVLKIACSFSLRIINYIYSVTMMNDAPAMIHGARSSSKHGQPSDPVERHRNFFPPIAL